MSTVAAVTHITEEESRILESKFPQDAADKTALMYVNLSDTNCPSTTSQFNTSSTYPTPDNTENTTGCYEQSRRQISSVIVSEEFLVEPPPQHTITYVEIPVVEEIVKTIPIKSVVEREKIVPRYEVEYVERVVEVPQIEYIDREVEKEEIQEIIRTIPGPKKIQEVPREVIRKVPKIEYVTVEKIVEVPGEIIQRDIAQRDIDFEEPTVLDRQLPVVVAQTIRPIITESPEVLEVDIYEYDPTVIPVDIHVATPVPSKLTAIGPVDEVHQPVEIPAAQYNTILRSLNAHLGDDMKDLPYIEEDGAIKILGDHETPGYISLADQDTDIKRITESEGRPASPEQLAQNPKQTDIIGQSQQQQSSPYYGAPQYEQTPQMPRASHHSGSELRPQNLTNGMSPAVAPRSIAASSKQPATNKSERKKGSQKASSKPHSKRHSSDKKKKLCKC